MQFLERRGFLIAEFFLLCLVLPTIIIVYRLAPLMFVFLWGAALYCLFILRTRPEWDLKTLWKWDAVSWNVLKPIVIRWIIATFAMVGFCLIYDPDRFLYLPRENPAFAIIFFFVYPLLSALPQEFIFCSFFFRRYRKFFGEGRWIILASAIVFAYAHVLYINPIAPTLSLIGGLIFAQTYAKTKSLALVTIEHGLYGNSLIIIGLGWYFYGGSVPVTP